MVEFKNKRDLRFLKRFVYTSTSQPIRNTDDKPRTRTTSKLMIQSPPADTEL